jgi:uncharacterized protein (TIGR01777 family)
MKGAMRIAVTGASGFVGRALSARLAEAGHEVFPLVRRTARPGAGEVSWDPAAGRLDASALAGVDAAFHLAGEPIGRRWTASRKAAIRESRVAGAALLARALASLPRPPRVLVSASAVGVYGDRGDVLLDETSPPGSGFLADVCREWEAATGPARDAGIRVVNARLGVVLGLGGGALAKMLPAFRLGLGGPVGPGSQWVSWISLHDAVRALVFLHERFHARAGTRGLEHAARPTRRSRPGEVSSRTGTSPSRGGRPRRPSRRPPGDRSWARRP